MTHPLNRFASRVTGHDLRRDLRQVIRKLDQLEITTMALRDDLTTAEGNLSTQLATVQQGLTDLATRISNLPAASDITQADVDALKADGDTLAEVATALGSLAEPEQPTS